MKRTLFSLMILAGSILQAQTYSSGNLSTGPTATAANIPAPAGTTWSELQGGNTTLGASGFKGGTSDFRLADDFTVPAAESWSITSIDVFAYQTSATVMPVDQLTMQILSGPPSTSPTVVHGNVTTNVFNAAGSGDALMYRTSNSAAGTTRKIWRLRGNVVKTLTPGTYWLNYQAHAINDSSVFFPVVTNAGVLAEPGANAQQLGTTGWTPLADGGTLNAQALPFIITYSVLGTSEVRQLDSRVIIYPNPTVDAFQLTLPKESLGAKTVISVVDASGKQVKTFKIAESYDVRDLAKGIYLIKIDDGQQIKATKLIKN